MRRSLLEGSVALLAVLLVPGAVMESACGGNPFIAGIDDAGTDTSPNDALVDAEALDTGAEATADATPEPRVVWSKAFGDIQAQFLSGLALQPSGDAVLSGNFVGATSFGGPTLSSQGASDIFVARLGASDGAHVFSARFGDPAPQFGLGVTVSASGDMFLAGLFKGTVSLGPHVLVANPDGSFDSFVVWLKADGSYNADYAFQGTNTQFVFGLALDPTRGLLVAGENDGTMTTPAQTVLTKGGADVFFAKVNSPNDVALGYGDDKEQRAKAIAVDANGNVAVAGQFQGAIDFGGGTPLVVSAGGYDVFVVKLDPSGKTLWAKSYGNGADQEVAAVKFDGAGNVIVAGDFAGQIGFGGQILSSTGKRDVYLAALDTNGTHVWSKAFGGNDDEIVTGLDVGPKGIALAGELTGTVDFGDGALTSAGATDLFVARFDLAGQLVGSARYGDAEAQTAAKIALEPNGDFVLAGTFRGAIAFDAAHVITSIGAEDVFAARITP